jgi:hypothetical protein
MEYITDEKLEKFKIFKQKDGDIIKYVEYFKFLCSDFWNLVFGK